MELSVLILTYNEEENIGELLTRIKKVVTKLTQEYEIILVDSNSTDKTPQIAESLGARVYLPSQKGYAQAYKEGISYCQGKYILNLDADLSHDPSFIQKMYQNRHRADLILASRYIPNAHANMGLFRKFVSISLNKIFANILTLPIRDISSGLRLYNSRIFKDITLTGEDFDILSEIVVRTHMKGYNVLEIPYHYFPRRRGLSKFKFFKFIRAHLKTLLKLWKLRNSLASADYDDRAFNSKIPLQRYWQRKKYHLVLNMLERKSPILDIGCGSGKILEALPEAYGIDLSLSKLRYRKRTNNLLICGDVNKLPIKDNTFYEIICNQIIEHIADDETLLREVSRVLKPGGNLIIGTPDFSKKLYLLIDFFYRKLLPGAYGDEHVTRWDFDSLRQKLMEHGFEIINHNYILWTDLYI